ncbi:MAG: hypothetical protein SFY92_08680 [Verrucomicrobiae bacterium]|nr:hypothetical protein [Verrucomicrobiae bacterium]
MNIDLILDTLNRHQVDYLLIGGINFLLRHKPYLTFDIDILVRDEKNNLSRLNLALCDLEAKWGPNDRAWEKVPLNSDWLNRQILFCLTTKHGPLDVFRQVDGLENQYEDCVRQCVQGRTSGGITYRGISDYHMLQCQLALPEHLRKAERVSILKAALEHP